MNSHADDSFPVSNTSEFASQQQSRAIRPTGRGHWEQVKPKPLPHIPELPENPTEEQRAAHEAAGHDWVQTSIDNCSVVWVPDPEPEPKMNPKSPATIDRQRPPMHPLPDAPAGLNINRHEAQCSVCQHPQREEIEQEFLDWMSPRATAEDYEIDFRAIYRHARAFNLVAIRNRRVRGVLSQVLERTENIPTPSADAIIRAVRAFTRVNDDGQWIEPPSHVIVSSGSHPSGPSNPLADAIEIPSDSALAPASAVAKSKSRRAANLAPSQLHENKRRRRIYPETHFAHPRAAKPKQKRKKFSIVRSRPMPPKRTAGSYREA